jgi:hypothetical protein
MHITIIVLQNALVCFFEGCYREAEVTEETAETIKVVVSIVISI